MGQRASVLMKGSSTTKRIVEPIAPILDVKDSQFNGLLAKMKISTSNQSASDLKHAKSGTVSKSTTMIARRLELEKEFEEGKRKGLLRASEFDEFIKNGSHPNIDPELQCKLTHFIVRK